MNDQPHIVGRITASGGDWAALVIQPTDRDADGPWGQIKLYAWSDGVVTWKPER